MSHADERDHRTQLVYVVFEEDYDGGEVLAVFSSESEAKRFAAQREAHGVVSVEEHEVRAE